ncbi:hypothetical protein [Enterocloster clostridioformis]|uniref:Uncharacterized protein n=1 Tax=Enterocloster clostridioformis TaxID=1531 RepID=A0AAP9S5C1_9FIRM|nr:hypothetical protein [Enterocloster clostridioformis]EHG33190.1 hypothetical protein HMPREF9467_00801 [ [[Clostridium] clostridioforme 2_1_49FAA]QIX89120.1 hypothetical protein FOC47_00080 [Enterocloster clostridioformis]QIX93925.1 hypothetical protein FOC47_27330 [Enterocloster clostridioformis]
MKEYKLFKTAKKTAKENGLILADGVETGKEKRVFDFSLLEEKKLKNKKG